MNEQQKKLLAAIQTLEKSLGEFQNANISINRDANGAYYSVSTGDGVTTQSFATRVTK